MEYQKMTVVKTVEGYQVKEAYEGKKYCAWENDKGEKKFGLKRRYKEYLEDKYINIERAKLKAMEASLDYRYNTLHEEIPEFEVRYWAKKCQELDAYIAKITKEREAKVRHKNRWAKYGY